MSQETYQWQKRVMVANPQSYLMRPHSIALSEASSPSYHHSGIDRSREKDWFVFQYTLAGTGIFRHHETDYEVGPGKGFLTSPGNLDIAYYYPPDGNGTWQFLFITFKDVNHFAKLINRDSGFVFNMPKDHPVITRLHAFGDHPDSTVEMRAGAASLVIQQLLSALIDSARTDQHQEQTIHLMRRATKLVEENLYCPYNAGMLADDLDVSHAHLCRVFRKELNVTPLVFLNRIKIRHACEQLRSTSLTCREIAEGLGYEPGSHFARLFKRMQGMTPNEFRKSGAMTL